ncbi:MAG: ACP phosphodiesterase [Bacteroidales bacterium]|nr:ACP phosphodiesterase [Bacteroidales bacterium]
MNFLAHLYLSGNDNDILIGNFIADSVKGKAYQIYRPKIQQGIILHRKIDELTDNHIITKDLASLFKPGYQKYSGIVIDIFYDHFLSKNWNKFSDVKLEDFIKRCHKVLLKNITILPPKVQGFLPIMVATNRLLSYSKLEGLKISLERMAKYTSLPEASIFAIKTLKVNYDYFNESFLSFFADIIQSVEVEYKAIAELFTD